MTNWFGTDETTALTWLLAEKTWQLQQCQKTPTWATKMENRITYRLDKIVALVSVEQSDLDALDAALDEATASIQARIQALIDAGTLPAADVSALQADVDNLKALAAPAPVEVPPVVE